MNINPLIENALAGLTFRGKIVPISHLVHTKTSEAYITFYTYLDQDEYFADDNPQSGTTYGTVDIFCKMLGNYKSLSQNVKILLRAAGFTTATGPEQYEKDTGYYHVSFNIQIENLEV